MQVKHMLKFYKLKSNDFKLWLDCDKFSNKNRNKEQINFTVNYFCEYNFQSEIIGLKCDVFMKILKQSVSVTNYIYAIPALHIFYM